jgi:hypothetical protein
MDLLISGIGWLIHTLFIVGYLIILSAPIWVGVWVIVELTKRRREKAGRR